MFLDLNILFEQLYTSSSNILILENVSIVSIDPD